MKNKAAQSLGRKGGKAKSDKKTAAAKANGLKGGRPRKILIEAPALNEGIISNILD